MTIGPDHRANAAMDALTADDVAEFLKEHPDFLSRRPDVIPHLIPPAGPHGDGVVDMRHYLLEKLRGELGRLSDQRRELMETTRANFLNQQRVHAAVLHLLAAQGLEELVRAVTGDLAVLLDLDAAVLVMENPDDKIAVLAPLSGPAGLMMTPPGAVNRVLGRADVALRGDIFGAADLWGHCEFPVRSEALVRLRFGATEVGDGTEGLLAFGSMEPDKFHPGQATDLLVFLAGVVERAITLRLD
jgi:uncharacterized protein YigA (DUF484 family)